MRPESGLTKPAMQSSVSVLPDPLAPNSTALAGKSFTWTTSNPGVATVTQAGVVTTIAGGPGGSDGRRDPAARLVEIQSGDSFLKLGQKFLGD